VAKTAKVMFVPRYFFYLIADGCACFAHHIVTVQKSKYLPRRRLNYCITAA